MSLPEPKLSRVAETFYQNFVNIVIAIISIVQGLAFNDLAARFSPIYIEAIGNRNYVLVAHFVLCFVLLLRIFQTYVTAALDYEKWELHFADMFVIFVIGLLEYFAFSALVPGKFDIVSFHWRLLVLSALGFVGYLRALVTVHRNRFTPAGVANQYYEGEMRLQVVNLIGAALLQGISIYIIVSAKQSSAKYSALGFSIALILVTNIFYSVRATFNRPRIDVSPFVSALDSGETAVKKGEPASIMIRKAEPKDIEALLDLAMENFAYVYEALFDTSPRLTRRIMRSALLAFGGRHEWGMRNFYVAIEPNSDRPVGLLRIDSKRTGIGFRYFASILVLMAILIRYVGISGLIRTMINSRAVQAASYPIFQSDEIHIQYLAVDKSFRRRSVASQLVEFAFAAATEQGKDYVALEVREFNRSARHFFDENGFVSVEKIESEHDDLFGKGRRIRMIKAINPACII